MNDSSTDYDNIRQMVKKFIYQHAYHTNHLVYTVRILPGVREENLLSPLSYSETWE